MDKNNNKERKERKNYFEEVAKETLCLFVNEKFIELKNLDKPDLQSKEINWGIEVRECKDEYDGRFEKFLRSCCNDKHSIESLKEKAKKMNIKNFWMCCDSQTECRAYSSHIGLVDFNEYKNKVAGWIAEKSNKSKDYKKFVNNGLYLFCLYPLYEWDIKEIIQMLQQNTFTHIFFDCKGCIYVYNVIDDIIEKKEFNASQYADMLQKLDEKYFYLFENYDQ